MQVKILEIASRISNPVTVAAFAIAFLGLALWTVVKAKNKPIAWLLAGGLIFVGIIPVIASTVLAFRGVYQIRVTVLDTNNQPVSEAEVKATTGEMSKTGSGWQFLIYPQTKPSDGQITVYATVPNSFLAGSTTMRLGKDYYPSMQVHLDKLPPVIIHGEVLDDHQRVVAGADVSLPACSQSTTTDHNGQFTFTSCVAQGQMVSMRAQKGKMTGSKMVIAGETAQIVLRDD